MDRLCDVASVIDRQTDRFVYLESLESCVFFVDGGWGEVGFGVGRLT